MKPQFSSTAVWKTAAVVIAVVVAVSLVGVVQAATPQSQIIVRDQDITSGVITIDSVTAPQDGWVVVYKDPNFSSGDIVGYAPVMQGVNTNVKVTLDARRVDATATRAYALPTLWVRLHVDNPVMGLFEWGLHNLPYNDAPVMENGHPVIAEFGTTTSQESTSAAPAAPVTTPAPAQPVASLAPAQVSTKPTGNAGPIVVKDQDLSTGVAIFDSVTAPQDGWIVVYKNPNFTSGDIVGYAPVHQGVNNDVRVTIDAKRIYTGANHDTLQPTLWAQLHVDNDVKGLFEWGLRGLPYNDPPVLVNGQPVIAEFGTWASQ
jgi:hypothetical protein